MSDDGRMPPRYGFDLNGYARQMYDGYWTPWHIAKDVIAALRHELAEAQEELAQRREHMRRGIEPGRPTGGVG